MKIGKHFVKSLTAMAAVVAALSPGSATATPTIIGAGTIATFSNTVDFTGMADGSIDPFYTENGATFDAPFGLWTVNSSVFNYNDFGDLEISFNTPVEGFGFVNLGDLGEIPALRRSIRINEVKFFSDDSFGTQIGSNFVPAQPANSDVVFGGSWGIEDTMSNFQSVILTFEVFDAAFTSPILDDFRFNPAGGGTPPTNNAVPEPTTALLGVMGVGAFLAVVTRARFKENRAS